MAADDYRARRARAVQYAAAQERSGPARWLNRCQQFVRMALGSRGGARSANAAWANVRADDRHPSGTPPAGVPVYWAGGRYGHAALSAGGGYVYSTDIRRTGRVDKVPISEITSRWRFRYLGWTETVNEVRVISEGDAAARSDLGGNPRGGLPSNVGDLLNPGGLLGGALQEGRGLPVVGGLLGKAGDAIKGGGDAATDAAGGVLGDAAGAAAGAAAAAAAAAVLAPLKFLAEKAGDAGKTAGFAVLGLALVGAGAVQLSRAPARAAARRAA